MKNPITLTEQLKAFDEGTILDSDGMATECYNFYDWFCKDQSLKGKATRLFKKVRTFVRVFNIDPEATYCFFKNNCPLGGSLYDDFRICSRATRDVLYTVTPKSGHTGEAEIWGQENDFKCPLYKGQNLREIYRNMKES